MNFLLDQRVLGCIHRAGPGMGTNRAENKHATLPFLRLLFQKSSIHVSCNSSRHTPRPPGGLRYL